MLAQVDFSHYPASVHTPPYDRGMLKSGIVHFGVGNFFRAHEAFYIDQLLEDDPRWGIIGIGLRNNASAREKASLLRQQGGLYSLSEASSDGSYDTRIIGALKDYILAPHNPQAVLSILTAPDLHLVSMTLTEGGYPYDAERQCVREDDPGLCHDRDHLFSPATAFGYIVAACQWRKDHDQQGFTVLSCDNLQKNGFITKQIILFLARCYNSTLAEWIERNVTFPNAMVDRITPMITPERIAELSQKTGLDDALPVLTESFTQWVVEDQFPYPHPALEKVGVQLVKDVTPYEQIKTRMLNASHGLLCYSARLLGYEIKDEALGREPLLRRLLMAFWNEDVIPTLTAPQGVSLQDYRDILLERFLNPAIRDQTLRVASDGASKIPVFWGPTVKALLEQKKPLTRIAYGLASYLELLQGVDEKGQSFTPREPGYTDAEWSMARSENFRKALELPTFKAWETIPHNRLDEQITGYRHTIRRDGVKATLEGLL
ncbi:mannitol dehydrogenase family protein [Acetobacteraceae bacterium ESL0709]|nr:mannitol dehydrogenase family protein [Acetobacteraceae bacterium ESL0697]MDF7678755.1 mannitol dehydrogenase family protein [Acetobacteraceae bacterium ESL0709]